MKWGEDRPACALASATWRRRPVRWQLLPNKLWRCLDASRGAFLIRVSTRARRGTVSLHRSQNIANGTRKWHCRFIAAGRAFSRRLPAAVPYAIFPLASVAMASRIERFDLVRRTSLNFP